METRSPDHLIVATTHFSFYTKNLPAGTLARHNLKQFFYRGARQGAREIQFFQFSDTFRLIEARQSRSIDAFLQKNLTMDKLVSPNRKAR